MTKFEECRTGQTTTARKPAWEQGLYLMTSRGQAVQKLVSGSESPGCGDGAKHGIIPSGQTWSEPLRSCPAEQGTVVYKVWKADSPSKPVQFEVGLSIEPGMEDLYSTI
jgi:hypothetical protein